MHDLWKYIKKIPLLILHIKRTHFHPIPHTLPSLAVSLIHTLSPLSLTPGLMDVSNPFKLNFIKNMLRSDFDTVGPCVVMAAPGFMQVGDVVQCAAV
jgi:hypothetical protein